MTRLFHTTVTPYAKERVASILENGFLSEGDAVDLFRELLASWIGGTNKERIVTTNSGTSALELAILTLCGPGKPDEYIIIPPQTFVATAIAVMRCGYAPRFADINPMTGNLDPNHVTQMMYRQVKAVIPVHWTGRPCHMHGFLGLSQKFGIPIIEDAAQAFGASYHGYPIGSTANSFSDATCFSFQATRHLTTGDGGAIVFHGKNGEQKAEWARKLSWFGINRAKDKPGSLGERVYTLGFNQLGGKMHMNNIAAALGIGNIDGLVGRLHWRRHTAFIYNDELRNVPGLTLLDPEYASDHAYWTFCFRANGRQALIDKLAKNDVEASVVHGRIDRHPLFRTVYPTERELRGQNVFDAEQLSIPCHEMVTPTEAMSIAKLIKEGW